MAEGSLPIAHPALYFHTTVAYSERADGTSLDWRCLIKTHKMKRETEKYKKKDRKVVGVGSEKDQL